jgi:hypothetical protein
VAETDPTAPPPPGPSAPFDIEQPACFYLGREYDLNTRQVLPDKYVMYDARDLTTHGVIVGMTGSGKTGLSIALLEEAAIDGIPCVILDPKGDLTNLLLQFPDLDPHRFEPWVNGDDARQKGLSVPEYARQLAERWRKGLADTAQTPERITRLRLAADYRIYTPGSEAGLPLSILGTLAAPKGGLAGEDLSQKVTATATALLGLTGIAGDPVQSREHVLVARLLQHAWDEGRDVDLPKMIHAIQDPPIRTVGAYNLETFFPARERLKFASLLNNVLASPSFAAWARGEPLDLGAMLYRAGRPQHLIFYLAHLDDGQRMFFTALLLEELLGWTRRQGGTTNLRALLYFDEVFGYLPPHPANPPSKAPLLTLLKQARAFGVGVLLATQNPVDLDYKALSNAGTWFVGKLQTERDKARLLEGLESVAAEHSTLTDRGYLERVIASLGNRVFLLHDVHRPAPVLFQSRWALSFLRGPMTREQVKALMEPVKERDRGGAPAAIPLCSHCHAELGPDVSERCPRCGKPPWANASFRLQDRAFREELAKARPPGVAPAEADNASSMGHMPPVLPPEVTQFYLPAGGAAPAGAEVEYQPRVLGFAEVAFVIDRRTGKEHKESLRLLARPPEPGQPVDWARAEAVEQSPGHRPEPGARWLDVPESLDTGRKLKALENAFADYLHGAQKLALHENRTLGLVREPGEALGEFLRRCRAAAEQERDKALELERAKFRPKFQALGAELPAERAPRAARGAALSLLLWVLGWLNPFRWFSSRKQPGRRSGGKQDEKVRKLRTDYESKRAEIFTRWQQAAEEVTPLQLKPRKADVRVTHFGLAWAPFWRTGVARVEPAYR